jgi:putative DNA-invertase from lambdoid prophage Rac
MRVAIYARVSTKQQKQDLQLDECRVFAKANGWEIVEYLETESSVKKRPIFDGMMDDAHRRKFDIVIAWKLDRIARSMKDFLDIALRLEKSNVRFLSVTQKNIDTDQKDPMGRFLLQLFASLAELERGIILERVKAGVKAAQARGVRFGRPRKVFHRGRALELREQGLSFRAIARELGVPLATVQRAVSPEASNPRQSPVSKVSPKRSR